MTDLQILTAVKNSGGTIRYTDLLNLGLTDAAFDPLADRARIHALRYAGALSGDLSACSSVSFTAQGHLLLAKLQSEDSIQQKIACDEAKKEKQQRFENQLAVANLFVPIITYILGVFTEHYAGILDFVLRLFG